MLSSQGETAKLIGLHNLYGKVPLKQQVIGLSI